MASSPSYAGICSILFPFCSFRWQPAPLYVYDTPPPRCELCACHLSASSDGSCTFPKTPAFRCTRLSWLLAPNTASSTQVTGPSTHSALRKVTFNGREVNLAIRIKGTSFSLVICAPSKSRNDSAVSLNLEGQNGPEELLYFPTVTYNGPYVHIQNNTHKYVPF